MPKKPGKRLVPLDAIDFPHIADMVCQVVTKINENPDAVASFNLPATKEQLAAMAITQMLEEYLGKLAE